MTKQNLGTPQRLVNGQTGAVAWQAAYLPFGEAQIATSMITNNLRFPGQYFDAETGLHYNWNRYYDPASGRYVSADPIGLEGGLNLYVYVGNNPINLFDIYGLIKWYGKFEQISLAEIGGLIHIKFTMESECIDRMKAVVTVIARGGMIGAGTPLSAISGSISMHDFDDTIKPFNFNGVFVAAGVNAGIGIGSSLSNIRLGNVFSDKLINYGTFKGIDISISISMGSSQVTNVDWKSCCTN